jgi:hypothetical protein
MLLVAGGGEFYICSFARVERCHLNPVISSLVPAAFCDVTLRDGSVTDT